MEKQWVNKWAELCDSTEADDENSYMYDGPEVDERIKELEVENARLRQQLNSANSQIQILNRVIAGDIE